MLEDADQETDRGDRDHPADEQVGHDLPGDDLPGVDRRDPEELDDAARALANERQRDQRHGEVLEDQRQHSRAVERQDLRLRWRDVLDLGVRRGGDDLGWDRLGGRRRVDDARPRPPRPPCAMIAWLTALDRFAARKPA